MPFEIEENGVGTAAVVLARSRGVDSASGRKSASSPRLKLDESLLPTSRKILFCLRLDFSVPSIEAAAAVGLPAKGVAAICRLVAGAILFAGCGNCVFCDIGAFSGACDSGDV